jgi:hypothetical protein
MDSANGMEASFADAPFADAPFADAPFADAPFADAPFADTPFAGASLIICGVSIDLEVAALQYGGAGAAPAALPGCPLPGRPLPSPARFSPPPAEPQTDAAFDSRYGDAMRSFGRWDDWCRSKDKFIRMLRAALYDLLEQVRQEVITAFIDDLACSWRVGADLVELGERYVWFLMQLYHSSRQADSPVVLHLSQIGQAAEMAMKYLPYAYTADAIACINMLGVKDIVLQHKGIAVYLYTVFMARGTSEEQTVAACAAVSDALFNVPLPTPGELMQSLLGAPEFAPQVVAATEDGRPAPLADPFGPDEFPALGAEAGAPRGAPSPWAPPGAAEAAEERPVTEYPAFDAETLTAFCDALNRKWTLYAKSPHDDKGLVPKVVTGADAVCASCLAGEHARSPDQLLCNECQHRTLALDALVDLLAEVRVSHRKGGEALVAVKSILCDRCQEGKKAVTPSGLICGACQRALGEAFPCTGYGGIAHEPITRWCNAAGVVSNLCTYCSEERRSSLWYRASSSGRRSSSPRSPGKTPSPVCDKPHYVPGLHLPDAVIPVTRRKGRKAGAAPPAAGPTAALGPAEASAFSVAVC